MFCALKMCHKKYFYYLWSLFKVSSSVIWSRFQFTANLLHSASLCVFLIWTNFLSLKTDFYPQSYHFGHQLYRVSFVCLFLEEFLLVLERMISHPSLMYNCVFDSVTSDQVIRTVSQAACILFCYSFTSSPTPIHLLMLKPMVAMTPNKGWWIDVLVWSATKSSSDLH